MCAGGGVTGALYEIGCLRALGEVLGRSVLDLDLYVGISGGAFVASLAAAGVSPREIYEEAVGARPSPFGLPTPALFRLGLTPGALLRGSTRAPRALGEALTQILGRDGRDLSDLLWAAFALLPPGLLDSSGIGQFLHALFERHLRGDRFADLPRRLYVVAVDLDSGEAVAFGKAGWRHVPVSQAVQASAALPGFYRPVRIDGRDYVDGGVKKTAHINLAIQSGADLVICINPIVPYRNDPRQGPLGGHLSERGVTWVLDQTLRIMLHGRMQYGLERYRRDRPDVDILLLEPTPDDLRMFAYHIMHYGSRRVIAEHGYRTTLAYLRRNAARCRRLFARHGIEMADPASVPEVPEPAGDRSALARTLGASLGRLEARLASRPRRRT